MNTPFTLSHPPSSWNLIHKGERVSVFVAWPAVGIMATRVEGHLDVSGATALASAVREHAARNPALRYTGFHDWAQMDDYDGAARICLTDLARELIARSDGIHILVSSPLVEFGIRTASVIVPNVHSHGSKATFDAALDAATRRQTRAPVSQR